MHARAIHGILLRRIKGEQICPPPPASSKNLLTIETLIRERGFGRTLSKQEKPKYPPIPTGFEGLDARLGGGLPRGAISEVIGPCSSGRTGLMLAALAQATQAEETTAYIDATDCLDPRSAEGAGVALRRLLWIRCSAGGRMRLGRTAALETREDQAWVAANLVVSAGGFGVIAIDLGGLTERKLRAWQRRPWMRLKQVLENTSTALAVLSEKHLTGSAAGVVLELHREQTEWDGLLGGIAIRAEVVRDKTQGTGGPVGEAA